MISTQTTRLFFAVIALFALLATATAIGQTNSGVAIGSVTDPSGAVIPGATVTIVNTVSGFTRSAVSDGGGNFRFYNLPFDPYRVTAVAAGFRTNAQTVTIASTVPTELTLSLQPSSSTTVTVEATDILPENDPNFHTDIDRSTIDRMPIESVSSALSSIVTLASPG